MTSTADTNIFSVSFSTSFKPNDRNFGYKYALIWICFFACTLIAEERTEKLGYQTFATVGILPDFIWQSLLEFRVVHRLYSNVDHGFPQPLYEKYGITDVFLIMPKLYHSTSFLIHYSHRDIENGSKHNVRVTRNVTNWYSRKTKFSRLIFAKRNLNKLPFA
jgi:hypothetical protein